MFLLLIMLQNEGYFTLSIAYVYLMVVLQLRYYQNKSYPSVFGILKQVLHLHTIGNK